MKAAVYRAYGPPSVVRIEECPTPRPAAGEVLVKIAASTVSTADWRIRSLSMPRGFGIFARPAFGLFAPRKKILGTEFSGVVTEVGSGVTRFHSGDRVFGFPGVELGCHAQYRTMSEGGRIAPMPAGCTFEEAASICFGGTTALHYLRTLAKVAAGERVLVVGAAGTVGSAAVQLARYLGAHVTGVCSAAASPAVASLHADEIIDYTRHDPLDEAAKYDVIVDCIGATTYRRCRTSLRDGGRLLLVAGSLPQLLSAPWTNITTRHRVMGGSGPERLEDIVFLGELVARGLFRPLVDSVYPLERIADAHARVESGHKHGSVVVTMRDDPSATDEAPAGAGQSGSVHSSHVEV